MSDHSYGLHRLATGDLHNLLRAIHRGYLLFPITRGGLVLARFGDLEAHLDALVGRDRAAAQAVLLAVLRERDNAGSADQPSAICQLAYRGISVPGNGQREPVDHVRELIATAEHSVLWCGVPAASRGRILTTLHAAQRGRALHVRLLVVGDKAQVEAFRQDAFPHGEPRPTFLVVPSDGPIPPPCLVVDGKTAILFGAPGEALADEAEGLGAAFVAHDPALASSLTAHVDAAAAAFGYVTLA